MLGLAVGAVTFSGSMVASGKLAGLLPQRPKVLPGHTTILLLCIVAILLLGSWGMTFGSPREAVATTAALSLLAVLVGVIVSIRVGGADMPVLISLLNALSGLAGAVRRGDRKPPADRVRGNGCRLGPGVDPRHVQGDESRLAGRPAGHAGQTTAGQVIPAAGGHGPPAIASPRRAHAPRTRIGKPVRGTAVGSGRPRTARRTRSLSCPAMEWPLQAQVRTVQLASRLQEMGKDVKFAIHPIAGRMPGHMHVLLAEAEVNPDMLVDLEDINPEFSRRPGNRGGRL